MGGVSCHPIIQLQRLFGWQTQFMYVSVCLLLLIPPLNWDEKGKIFDLLHSGLTFRKKGIEKIWLPNNLIINKLLFYRSLIDFHYTQTMSENFFLYILESICKVSLHKLLDLIKQQHTMWRCFNVNVDRVSAINSLYSWSIPRQLLPFTVTFLHSLDTAGP